MTGRRSLSPRGRTCREPVKQFLDRATGDWIYEIRCDFSQGGEHKATLSEPRMGEQQRWCVHDQITNKNKVEIKRACGAGKGTLPPTLVLDELQHIKEMLWFVARPAKNNPVEERWLLVGNAFRGGFEKTRDA